MLRNDEYTDRELLHVIADACGTDGLASSDDIADTLGLSDNGRSRAGRVSTRLAWMARYGFIEGVDASQTDVAREGHFRLWRITEVGQQLMGGRLTKSVESAIANLDPGAQLLMMRQLTRRTFDGSAPAVATAVRREYLHNVAADRDG